MKGIAAFHPAVALGFFAAAIVLTVLTNRPVLQGAGLALAAACYLCVRGRAGWKVLAGFVPVLAAVALANPLLNTQGDTVLFTWAFGRPFTAEALAFGASTAMMFASVLLWFLGCNRVVTSDRFAYLFGRFASAAVLVFAMVLRLVPAYQRKARDIASARACVGLGASQGTLEERTRAAGTLLSALVGCALEESVVTADSMRSRGFGTCRRTSYARYRMGARDVALLAVLALLLAGAFAAAAQGALAMEYFPGLALPACTPLAVVGGACFLAFLAAPTVVNAWEAASWRISLSRI